MKKIILSLLLAFFLVDIAFAQFNAVTSLDRLATTKNTAEKPQSKAWTYSGKHWAVLCNTTGTAVWKLDGQTWKKNLTISAKTNKRADCKVVGNVVHILLFHDTETDLISIEYNPGTGNYQLWQARPATIRIPCDLNSETATIDVDSNGRMWLASDENYNITVRWSDSPYKTWSNPISVASGIDPDDIGAVVAFPMFNKIGVFWSNQVTKRFGFKMHTDGADPNIWSANEVPASQSALNIGGGMADDHLNLKVSSNGTLYCAVKTSYDTPGYSRISLLVRRPSGIWDNLYKVSELGTRGIVILNEQTGKIRVVYAESEVGGDILYRESPMSAIAFGPQFTLVSGMYNNPSSIKDNYTGEVPIIASDGVDIVGVLALDNGNPPAFPAVPKLLQPIKGGKNVPLVPTLTWEPVSNAAYYQLQLSTVSNFATLITDSSNIATDTFFAANLAYNTRYFWRVRAFNAGGSSNWTGAWDFTTEPVPMPAIPTLSTPIKGGKNVSISPELIWKPANNAVSYQVQVSTASNFATVITDSSNIVSETLAVTGIAYNTRYFWRARTYNANGVSNWSAIWDFTTENAPVAPPAIPALLSPANNITGTNLNLTLSWAESASATTYQLQVATAPDFLTPVYDLPNLPGLSQGITNLNFNTRYYWRVRAGNNIGQSSWSGVWSFTTLPKPAALVGYWAMNDLTNTTLADGSLYGNHATTVGSPVFVSGVLGKALHLNGTNQYATVPSSASLNPDSAITLAAWLKPETSGSRQIILKKGINADGYELSLSSSAKVTFRYNQVSGGNTYQLLSLGSYPADGNTWVHVAATCDRSTIKIYLNGTLNKTMTLTGAPLIAGNTESFSIGAQSNGVSRFQGAIDDARIYRVALTAAEISNLAALPPARMAGNSRESSPTGLQAYPNPFRDHTRIQFKLSEEGEYAVTLHDLTGKAIEVIQEGKADAGENVYVDVEGAGLRRGLYFVRLISRSKSQVIKVIHDPQD